MSQPDPPVRVVIVDDHDLFVEGLIGLLDRDPREPRVAVVGTARDARGGLARITELDPDVALVEVALADGTRGADLIEALRERGVRTRIVLLSGTPGRRAVMRSLRAGVDSFLPRSIDGAALADAIRLVARGLAVLPHDLALTAMLRFATMGDDRFSRLTDDQLQLWRLLTTGCSYAELAAELQVSERTARRHTRELLALLEVDNRCQAAELAGRVHLVEARLRPRGSR